MGALINALKADEDDLSFSTTATGEPSPDLSLDFGVDANNAVGTLDLEKASKSQVTFLHFKNTRQFMLSSKF